MNNTTQVNPLAYSIRGLYEASLIGAGRILELDSENLKIF